MLEQEHRFSCVLRECSDVSTNFLDQIFGGLVPAVSTATGKKMWETDSIIIIIIIIIIIPSLLEIQRVNNKR